MISGLDYYPIKDVATQLGRNPIDLIRMAEFGKTTLFTNTYGRDINAHTDEIDFLSTTEISKNSSLTKYINLDQETCALLALTLGDTKYQIEDYHVAQCPIEIVDKSLLKYFEKKLGCDPCTLLEDPYNNPIDFYSVTMPKSLNELFMSKSDVNTLLNPGRTAKKPIGTKERQSLHRIILALHKLAKLDFDHLSASATSIKTQAELLGISVSENTITTHLKAAKKEL